MRTSLLWMGTGLFSIGLGLGACSAVTHPNGSAIGGEGGEGGGNGGAATSFGGGGSGGGLTTGGEGGSDIPVPTQLVCPVVPQEILVLDFRSGWWSGGGGGQFGPIPLQAMAQTCNDITVEYHHFETGVRVKCLYTTSGGTGCQEIGEAPPATPEAILSLFEKPSFDEYTQVWILSGSALDSTDVSLTGALFDHFLEQTTGSCTPVLIGAGDGFVTHGNSVAAELGLGQVFTTELALPGFFSVAMEPIVTVDTLMMPGTQLATHVLFQDVDSIADQVSTISQSTHGDSLIPQPAVYDIIAHDTSGRAAIAVGKLAVAGGEDRPFLLDAGFQRYYGMDSVGGTQTLLQNMVKYLGSVGCKAEPPK